ncbi:MAG TPA: dihydroneopterin aldolase [Clostridia bacterium]|nr:dihydroneopterin aldolase [Clostridia bacterium]
MDKIIIKDLRVFAYHGVNPEEKTQGQNFEIDLTAQIDLSKPCITDFLDDTVSYAKIIKTIRRVMIEEKNDLIERAAQRVAGSILNEFSAIQSVEVTLKKPEAPIKADFNYVAVNIIRNRGEQQK